MPDAAGTIFFREETSEITFTGSERSHLPFIIAYSCRRRSENEFVLSGVERTGPTGGGPAHVARRAGWSAVRTERRGQDRRKPAIRGP